LFVICDFHFSNFLLLPTANCQLPTIFSLPYCLIPIIASCLIPMPAFDGLKNGWGLNKKALSLYQNAVSLDKRALMKKRLAGRL
jgi:hypothetical protein